MCHQTCRLDALNLQTWRNRSGRCRWEWSHSQVGPSQPLQHGVGSLAAYNYELKEQKGKEKHTKLYTNSKKQTLALFYISTSDALLQYLIFLLNSFKNNKDHCQTYLSVSQSISHHFGCTRCWKCGSHWCILACCTETKHTFIARSVTQHSSSSSTPLWSKAT